MKLLNKTKVTLGIKTTNKTIKYKRIFFSNKIHYYNLIYGKEKEVYFQH